MKYQPSIYRRLNKQSFTIGIVSFMMSFSSALVISCALDFAKFIGADAATVVSARMIGEGAGYLGRFVVGFLSDIQKDRRKFLLLGYGTIIIIKPIFILCCFDIIEHSLRIFLYNSANISEKFFGSMRDPVRDAMIADYTKEEDLSVNLAVRRFLSYMGSIFGALTSFLLSDKIPYYKLFSIALFPAFFGVFLLYKNIHNKEPESKVKKNMEMTFFSDMKATGKSKLLVVLLIGVFLLFLGKLNEFSLWFTASKFNINQPNSILFLMFYLSSSVGSILISFLVDRISPYLLIVAACLFYVAVNCTFTQYVNHSTLIFSTVFYGIYGAFVDILTTFVVLRIFHNTKWKASIISILNFTVGVSYSTAGFLNKLIISKYGILGPFYSSFIPSIMGIIIILFVYVKYGKKQL